MQLGWFDPPTFNRRVNRALILLGASTLLCLLVVGPLVVQERNQVLAVRRQMDHTYTLLLAVRQVHTQVNALVVAHQLQQLRAPAVASSERQHYLHNKDALLESSIHALGLTLEGAPTHLQLEALQKNILVLITALDQTQGSPNKVAATQSASITVYPQLTLLEQQFQQFYSQQGVMLEHLAEKWRAARTHFYVVLIMGGVLYALLLLALNAFLVLQAQRTEKLRQQMSQTEERFALAMRSTADGVYDWDIPAGTIYYSPRFKEMLGYLDHELPNVVDSFTRLVHPDDVDRVWDYANQYLAGELKEYNSTFRMQHKNGSWIWINSRARAAYDADGKAIRMIGAHTDITHLKAIEERLETEKQAALQASSTKGEFLAKMSHEIRTPLNVIVGLSRLMQQQATVQKDKQLHEWVDALQVSSTVLMDLINDILDFSRLESGKMPLQYGVFDLRVLVDDLLCLMSPRAKEKGIALRLDWHADTQPLVWGDKFRLRQILLNLLGNAIKFTPQGEVLLAVSRQEDQLHITVRDTGIGISAAALPHIFEHFHQANSSHSRQYGGTGLGLAIAWQLVQQMQGTLTANSVEGEGSQFALTLPCDIPPEHQQAAQTREVASATPDIFVTADPENPASVMPPNVDVVHLARAFGRVLLVEDYPLNVLVAKAVLEALHLPYDVAEDGQQALMLLQQRPYRIVLMDIQMPGMDGFELAQRIRELEQTIGRAPCCIVAATAHALAGDRQRCLDAGMDDYLTKPLEEATLVQVLYRCHQRRAAMATAMLSSSATA